MTAPRILRVGVLHSKDRCAFCGATEHLTETMIPATRAQAMRCDDVVACQLRRYTQRAA
jgi:hypothetical protein